MREYQTALVVGAGTMGQGIAQICAQAGMSVHLVDVDETSARRGLAQIEKILARQVEKARLTNEERNRIVASIEPGTEPLDIAPQADLVVEAIPERMQLKLELFSSLSARTSEHALLATNTSSLSVTEIAGSAKRPERVIGLHFFNPVPVMELLEIVVGLNTGEAAVEEGRSLAVRLGKKPIVVRDVPGFATSRLGVILGCEAIRMLESGVASAADIDAAMELGYRHPMGPLRLTDLVGLDVRLAILEHLHEEIGEQFRPPTLLRQMVRAGRLGKKVGRGFYDY